MKTLKEWLEELPTEVKEKALNNVYKLNINPELALRYREESLKSAIMGAFIWMETEEGNDYWYNIYKEL